MGALDRSLLEDRIRFCVGGWEYHDYSVWEDVITVWEDVTTVYGRI